MERILLNKMTVDEWIQFLSKPEQPSEWRYLEERDEIWLEVLRRAPDLKYALTLSKRLGVGVLLKLAQDEDIVVRLRIAMKRRLDSEVFEQLAKDPEAGVRLTVATNPNVPPSALMLLSQDTDPEVRSAASRRLRQGRSDIS